MAANRAISKLFTAGLFSHCTYTLSPTCLFRSQCTVRIALMQCRQNTVHIHFPAQVIHLIQTNLAGEGGRYAPSLTSQNYFLNDQTTSMFGHRQPTGPQKPRCSMIRSTMTSFLPLLFRRWRSQYSFKGTRVSLLSCPALAISCRIIGDG